MIKKSISVNGASALILGITFKENCPDVRNTKIVDVVKGLEDYGINITVFDPWANPQEVMHEYNIHCTSNVPDEKFDAIVLAVAHNEFLEMDIEKLKKENAIVYDVKGILQYCDSKL
jgi:UDP-N-acetyl-D-galactosamine dehydrogenase